MRGERAGFAQQGMGRRRRAAGPASFLAMAFLLFALVLPGDMAGPGPGRTVVPGDGWKVYTDTTYGWSIRYPPRDWAVRIDFENAGRPEYVIRRRVTFSGPGRALIMVDLWRDTSGLGLMEWVHRHRRFLFPQDVIPPDRPNARVVGTSALFMMEPETVQSPARLTTVALKRGKVFRISYIGADAGRSESVYRAMLASFRVPLGSQRTGAQVPEVFPKPWTKAWLMGDEACCGYESPGNPYLCYNCGNCTWWAWSKRPDLPPFMGNAKDWGDRARAAGYPVGPDPQVGDIVVIQPGAQRVSSEYGHVAYVEELLGGGRFRVSEMWYPNGCDGECCKVCYDYVFHTGEGVEFIHRKDSPMPTLTPPPILTATPAPTEVPAIHVTLADGMGAPGSTSNPVALSIDNRAQGPVWGGELVLVYDGAIGLALGAVSTTERTAGVSVTWGMDTATPSAVEADIALRGEGESLIITGTGPILRLLFDVDASAQVGDVSSLYFSAVRLSDPSGCPLAVDVSDGGRFTILSGGHAVYLPLIMRKFHEGIEPGVNLTSSFKYATLLVDRHSL